MEQYVRISWKDCPAQLTDVHRAAFCLGTVTIYGHLNRCSGTSAVIEGTSRTIIGRGGQKIQKALHSLTVATRVCQVTANTSPEETHHAFNKKALAP